jgi:signal transduction histidine kinase
VTVPKYREYLDAIHASGGHLLNVVNDILNLSKIEAGKLELALQPIHLEGAIREAAGLIEPLAQKRGIGLVTWIGCREVVADRQALQQVLLNLLSNAIKFSPEGATVEICARETDSVCEIAVTDHGCGMAEEMLENLGKPFVQAEGAYSRTHQGTGLGLAISFMLTRGMNGKIAVTSAEGAGTTVTVTLPKACSAAEPQRRKILVA